MAYPMLRSETSFQNPEDYKSYVQAEGLKRAEYLASMDQFYANLDEATRQFNETLVYKRDVLAAEREMFGEELAQSQSQFEAELEYNRWLSEQKIALAEQEAEQTSWYQKQQIKLGERGLDIQEKQVEAEAAKGGTVTYFDPTISSFKKEYLQKQQELEARALTQPYSVTSGPQSGSVTYNPSQPFGDYIDPTYGWTTSSGRWF